MRGWLARPILALAGALVSVFVVALYEALRAAGPEQVAVIDAMLGDAAVLAPLGTGVGLGVAVVALLLDPRRSFSVHGTFTRFEALRTNARARIGAVFLVAPAATGAWTLASAHVARSAVASGAPWAVGVEIALTSVVLLVLTGLVSLAAIPFLARHVTTEVKLWIPATCGATYAIAAGAMGLRLGDSSGNGPTPLAILGVLARPELDLSPVFALGGMAVGALLGERAWRSRRWGRVLLAALVSAGVWGLVVQQAHALSDNPRVAHAIEQGAPLGHVGLALARRATDRDHDGASALFGGGDCDDSDPRRSPNAIDIPGNGIDEDCSGADLPLPHVVAPAPAQPKGLFPKDLNLVLITVDTLRIDLGFMGYPLPVSPNLDALAARSTVFDRAYSMASYTGKSVGPTMIGKYPSETLRDGAHFDTYFADNVFLAERLHAAGFRTMGVASHWYFKPKYGLPQGMDTWDMSAMPPDSGGDADASVTSPALTDAAIRLLSDDANVRGRFFLWAHYFDPHAMYVSHPEAPSFRSGGKSWSKPLYDGEVWFTDHHLGRLFDFIESQPWGKKTAIVVTADHGEAFDEHGMSWHGVDLWEPLVHVPLVVYVPGAPAHRITKRRSLVDLVPTVLDLMGLPQPPAGELSGRSTALAVVSPYGAPIDERDVFLDMPVGPQVSQHRALIHGESPGMKLMSEGGNWYMLFDLSTDTDELRDLSRDKTLMAPMIEAFEGQLSGMHIIRVDPPATDTR